MVGLVAVMGAMRVMGQLGIGGHGKSRRTGGDGGVDGNAAEYFEAGRGRASLWRSKRR